MKETSIKLVAIGLGGGVGSMGRYLLASLAQRLSFDFPLGTLTVNVVGCLVMGYVAAVLDVRAVDERFRLALQIGVLGGFTTFSTFSLDTLKLIENRQPLLGLTNMVLSLSFCLVGVWAGQRVGKWMV